MSFVAATTQRLSLDRENNRRFVLDSDYMHNPESRRRSASTGQYCERSSVDANLLSPSDSLSPSNNFEISNGSASGNLSQYQPSDFSDLDEDPFFGVSFTGPEIGTPNFLDRQASWEFSVQSASFIASQQQQQPQQQPQQQQHVEKAAAYPLTPEQTTASIHSATPQCDQRAPVPPMRPNAISPRELHNSIPRSPLVIPAPQTVPSQNGSGRSSEDGLAPAPFDMACQSPRVTISMWDKDNKGPIHTVEGYFDRVPVPEPEIAESAGDLISSIGHERDVASQPRDSMGQWHRDPTTGQGGLDPKKRLEGEIASINDIVRRRELDERNEVVGDWVTQNTNDVEDVRGQTSAEIRIIEEENRRTSDNVPLGNTTENRHIPGQTYYSDGVNGQLTEQDYGIMLTDRNWADAPILFGIQNGTPGQHQPQSSQAAIEKFERMCRDNDSIISRAATWGTRRRSLPSVVDLDIEGITSGNFLKKLSLSRGNSTSKSGSLLKDLRGLVRRPSAATMRKRSRSGQGEALFQQQQQQQELQAEESFQGKPESSTTHLSPISRASSWSKKPTSSINEALVSMGHNFASIGAAQHCRSGSVSNVPTATASKGALSGLGVKTSLRRQRSKSELPKPSAPAESFSNIADLWRRTGGPPVASISRAYAEPDEEEEDDDDFSFEDNDMKMDPNLIDDITPNNAGFSMHIQLLNPSLPANSYLVERLAQQQVVRYKQLLNYRIKHLGIGATCPNGLLCVAMGGSANVLDSKGDVRDPDSQLTRFEDDDVASMEGAITQESFPADIPMPPTQRLPAEFECQLCYQHKKLSKPSDWTKHVHEDVQPFTCTWEKCQPKMFKRKADWVRHENEGHRHLEWWACDIEDCQHVCYRRDNFLQHLVREHKYVEPKIKNKAALKKASSLDVTWHKVEQCHRETPKQPSEEPCRFCGKQFPTWKKLTVHLAKHMEQIALPVLRLVAAKAAELKADTIISPVQDVPLRHDFHALGEHSKSPALQFPSTPQQHAPQASPLLLQHPQQPSSLNQQVVGFRTSPHNQGQLAYRMMVPGQLQSPFYSPRLDGRMGQNLNLHPHSSMGAGQPHNQGLSPDMWVMSAESGNATAMGSGPGFVPGPGSFGGMCAGGSSVLVASQQGGMEQFRGGLDGLGLQNIAVSHLGGQLSFDGMMDGSSSGNGSLFSGHGNHLLSRYSRSPQQHASHWAAGQQHM